MLSYNNHNRRNACAVFQKCRIIAQRERDAERERLKRLRRLKNKTELRSPLKGSSVAVSADSDPDPMVMMMTTTTPAQNPSTPPLNLFDSAWDEALIINTGSSASVSASSVSVSSVQRQRQVVQVEVSNALATAPAATQRPVVGNLRQPHAPAARARRS